MRKTYYKILSNDGCPQSDKISSLPKARKELRDMVQFDADEFSIQEGEIDYYIEKYVETDETIYHEKIE